MEYEIKQELSDMEEEWLSDIDDPDDNDSDVQKPTNNIKDRDEVMCVRSPPFKVFSYPAARKEKKPFVDLMSSTHKRISQWNKNNTLMLLELYAKAVYQGGAKWRYIGRELRKAGFDISDKAACNRFKYLKRQYFKQGLNFIYYNELHQFIYRPTRLKEKLNIIKRKNETSRDDMLLNKPYCSEETKPPSSSFMKNKTVMDPNYNDFNTDPLSLDSKEHIDLHSVDPLQFTVIKTEDDASSSSNTDQTPIMFTQNPSLRKQPTTMPQTQRTEQNTPTTTVPHSPNRTKIMSLLQNLIKMNELEAATQVPDSKCPTMMTQTEQNGSTNATPQAPNGLKRIAPKIIEMDKLQSSMNKWVDEFRRDAEKREEAKERRHQEVIGLQRETNALYREMMTKLIDKMKK